MLVIAEQLYAGEIAIEPAIEPEDRNSAVVPGGDDGTSPRHFSDAGNRPPVPRKDLHPAVIYTVTKVSSTPGVNRLAPDDVEVHTNRRQCPVDLTRDANLHVGIASFAYET